MNQDLYLNEQNNYVFGVAQAITRKGLFSFVRYTKEFTGEIFENMDEYFF